MKTTFDKIAIGQEFVWNGEHFCKIAYTKINCSGWDSIHNAIKTIDPGDQHIAPEHKTDFFLEDTEVIAIPSQEVWYQWKEIVDCDGVNRILNVQRDPMVHENSVGELLFESEENAREYLYEQEISIENGWFVAKVTIERV